MRSVKDRQTASVCVCLHSPSHMTALCICVRQIMLPGVWVKMVSCSLRSPPRLATAQCACLSSKRSPCLFSLLWNNMFSSQPYSSRIESYPRPTCVSSSSSMALMKQTIQITTLFPAEVMGPLGVVGPNQALVWLVDGRWAWIVKIGKEKQTENNVSCKMQFCHDLLASALC